MLPTDFSTVRMPSATFQPAGLYMLGAAFTMAIALICTKKLTATEQSFTIVFWMNAMQLPMNLAGSDPLFLLRLDASHTLPILGLAVSGLTGHYCFATAFRYGDATTVVEGGHVVVSPPGEAHGFTNTGADELRLVWGVGGQVLKRPRPDVPTQRF